MKTAVLLLIVSLLVSGCTVRIGEEAESAPTQTTMSVCTVNGERVPCGPQPTNHTQTPVEIQERIPLTEGASRSWSWSVDPGANVTKLRFMFLGHDGQTLGAALDKGCVKMSGPGLSSWGNCSGPNTSISVNPVVISPELAHGTKEIVLDALSVSDYRIQIDIGPAAMDLYVEIQVTY